MSAKYTYRALSFDPGHPIKKLILICMADISNDSGECYPGHTKIASKCCAGISTVRKHIKELVSMGLIIERPRFNESGRTSNMYKICLPMTDWEAGEVPPRSNTPATREQNPLPPDSNESTHIESTQLNTLVEQASTVIDELNKVVGTKYRKDTQSHIKNITARLRDGHSVDDLKAVIHAKHKDWKDSKQYSQYLRPGTLFSAEKFQGYLLAAKKTPGANYANPTKTANYRGEW